MLDKLEGRFFVTFLAVLEEGSFSQAADKLGYVQSTVTAQIRQLEQTCGQTLFQRLPRGVVPTEAGREMADYARRFRRLGEMLEERMSRLEEPRGTVVLRTMESFCVTRLSGFLPGFLGEYPEIRLRLETGFQSDIVDQVARHAADIGIVPRDPGRDDLTFEPLVDEKMIFAASAELARGIEDEGWSALNGRPAIGFGRSCLYRAVAGKLLGEQGAPVPEETEFPSTELIRQMVAAGHGVAFLPEIAVRGEIASGRVAEIPMPREVRLTHGLITRKDRVLNAPARALRNKLSAYFA
ncbi:LysR family transcriptional regulator [Cohnella candidum]|uniref:LysR family transcriptional regulator n=1 Tax=Cohnella candidum TaxID=2674991 RepID=A0A3G3K1H3_9BACL|nr:LysR family transcriptional regulator [Cohnella candidum]AYQ74272.1 LysR family transcriptional regulator [Cohnella candidum]